MKNRKLFITALIGIIVIASIAFQQFLPLRVGAPEIDAKSGILMDADTGQILYKKNAEIPLAPASMSKMMTEYIVLEKIHQGELAWDDYVTVSETSVASEGVTVPLQLGEKVKVRDLFVAMALPSANNAAVLLAEKISGSEENFTVLMNEKANELGLSDKTVFLNSTGLQNKKMNDKETSMTATDVGKLAFQLITKFPEVLEITKKGYYELEYRQIGVTSTNVMLYSENPDLVFRGVDGLKTGYTEQAGYCFAATAIKDGKRIISVVMGTPSKDTRFTETKKLLSYGFNDNSVTLDYLVNKVSYEARNTISKMMTIIQTGF